MAQELADLQSSEQTGAGITETGNIPVAEPTDIKSEEKAKSLRETIVAAKEEVEAEEKKRGNPYKSADGKFTKKPLEAASKPDALAVAPESEAKPQETVTPQPQAAEPPKAWPKDKHELWTKLPQEAKDFLLTREDQVSKGFEKYSVYNDLEKVLAPHRPMIQAYGRSEAEVIDRTLTWLQAIERNSAQAIPALAQAYNINLTGSAQPLADQQQPQIDYTAQQLQTLQQRIEAQERALAEREKQEVSDKVSKWAADKPHYEKVRRDMGLMIQAAAQNGIELSLDEAYHKATWSNPEISNELKKAEFEATVKKQQEAAHKAKIAAISTTSRSPAGAVNGAAGDKGSLRSTIKAAFEEAKGASRV